MSKRSDAIYSMQCLRARALNKSRRGISAQRIRDTNSTTSIYITLGFPDTGVLGKTHVGEFEEHGLGLEHRNRQLGGEQHAEFIRWVELPRDAQFSLSARRDHHTPLLRGMRKVPCLHFGGSTRGIRSQVTLVPQQMRVCESTTVWY